MHTKTRHTQKAAREPPLAYGAAPPPPAAQSPTHEAHQPPNLSTLIAPCRARSSPTAQPLEQHGLGRARYPILAHYGRIAPRRRRTPHPLPAATRPATQPHIAHTRPGQERRAATQTRLTSSLRPLCHFSLSHHLVCHESTSQAHAYCDRPRRLCHATLSIHARGPFTEGSVRLAATGHRLSSRRRATRATACHRPSAH